MDTVEHTALAEPLADFFRGGIQRDRADQMRDSVDFPDELLCHSVGREEQDKSAVLMTADQRQQAGRIALRKQQISADSDGCPFCQDTVIGVQALRAAGWSDKKSQAPGDVKALRPFDSADDGGSVRTAVISRVDSKMSNGVKIRVGYNVFYQIIVGAVRILQHFLHTGKKALLKAPLGKGKSHIHQVSDASLRSLFYSF